MFVAYLVRRGRATPLVSSDGFTAKQALPIGDTRETPCRIWSSGADQCRSVADRRQSFIL